MFFKSKSKLSESKTQHDQLTENHIIELVIRKQGVLIKQQRLQTDTHIIGTSDQAQIKLEGTKVARQHARLSCNLKVWYLEDLASMTGTYVNNNRIIEYNQLLTSDTITIGDYSLQLVEPEQKKVLNIIEDSYSAHKSIPLLEVCQTNNNLPAHQKTQPVTIDYTMLLAPEYNLWREKLHDEVVKTFDLRRQNINKLSTIELRQKTTDVAQGLLLQWQQDLPSHLKPADLLQAVIDDIVGLGPLEVLLKDDEVSEIMVNSPSEIFIEKAGKIQRSPFTFPHDQAVLAVIDRIITPLGRRIDQSSPMVDARLKDGSRVNAIIPPLAIKGPCITIRKFPSKRLQMSDLIQFGSMDKAMAEFFKIAVGEGKNILVSGGTGTGKTTLLNVLSNQIPHHERVITIEDAAELQLEQPDLVSLESKPANIEGSGAISIRDLVKNALRMRPNRIVVGECRGAEALDMLQAMNTGHDGSLTTLHANTPRDALSRLEVMVMMAGMDIPLQAIREQIAAAIHIIVQQTRFPCGARKITYVTEVVGMESGIIQLQDLFLFRRQGNTPTGQVIGEFAPTGLIPEFYEKLAAFGKILDTSLYTSHSNGLKQ